MNNPRNIHAGKSQWEKGQYIRRIKRLPSQATLDESLDFPDTDSDEVFLVGAIGTSVDSKLNAKRFASTYWKEIVFTIFIALLIPGLFKWNGDMGRVEEKTSQNQSKIIYTDRKIDKLDSEVDERIDKMEDKLTDVRIKVSELSVEFNDKRPEHQK